MFLDIGTRAPTPLYSIIIDNKPRSGVNVLCNLDHFHYPFKDNSFQVVRIWDYLEHFEDIIKVLEEIYRILRPNGILKIMVPHFSNYYAFTDPTHKHFFGIKTMDYLIPNTKLYTLGYTNAKYEKLKASIGLLNETRGLKKFILKLINRFSEHYERHFAFILPVSGIYYELKAIKQVEKEKI